MSFSCMQSAGPALLQSHEELLYFKSGRIKERVGLQSLARGVFKTKGIFCLSVLIIGGFSRFPTTQKPPLSSHVTLTGDFSPPEGETRVLLQEEDSALFLNVF